MNEKTFKQRVCQEHGLEENQYLPYTLKKTLFLRMRFLGNVIGFFSPDYLLPEKRLLERVAEAINLKEVSDEVDFYQHKFVVNHWLKESLRFRLSGYRLLRMASRLFEREPSQRPGTS